MIIIINSMKNLSYENIKLLFLHFIGEILAVAITGRTR